MFIYHKLWHSNVFSCNTESFTPPPLFMYFGLHLPLSMFWLLDARIYLETRTLYLRWSPTADEDEALLMLPPLYTPFQVCLRSNAGFVPITWNGECAQHWNKAKLMCCYSAIECGKEPTPKAPVIHIRQYGLNVNVKVNLRDTLVGYMGVGKKKKKRGWSI